MAIWELRMVWNLANPSISHHQYEIHWNHPQLLGTWMACGESHVSLQCKNQNFACPFSTTLQAPNRGCISHKKLYDDICINDYTYVYIYNVRSVPKLQNAGSLIITDHNITKNMWFLDSPSGCRAWNHTASLNWYRSLWIGSVGAIAGWWLTYPSEKYESVGIIIHNWMERHF